MYDNVKPSATRAYIAPFVTPTNKRNANDEGLAAKLTTIQTTTAPPTNAAPSERGLVILLLVRNFRRAGLRLVQQIPCCRDLSFLLSPPPTRCWLSLRRAPLEVEVDELERVLERQVRERPRGRILHQNDKNPALAAFS
jgi:hypothetical protein